MKKIGIALCFCCVMALFAACTDNSYLNAVPRESTALLSIDPVKMSGLNHVSVLRTLLQATNISKSGIDVSHKIMLFEAPDGNLGVCAKVQDEDELTQTFAQLATKNVCPAPIKRRGFYFTVLKDAWVVGWNNTAMLVMGPVTVEAQSSLQQQIAQYLKQDEAAGITQSRLYEKLDSLEGSMTLVAQATALPQQFLAPLTLGMPKKADGSEVIIAAEMEAPLRITSGPAIQHSGDLAAILSSLTPGEVLFLDEIHRMSRPAEEMLYMAMEDFRVDIVVGKGAGATSIPLELPQFTLVGATTRAGLLPGPLRDRFGFTGHLEFYSVEELELVLRRSAGLMDMQITSEGFTEIAGRSRGTPRIANRLLRRVRDWALVNGVDRINATDAATALDMYEVDSRGLDRLDRAVLEALIHKFGGGPVGLSTLAIAVGEETETVETVAEPYLVREGLIGRTPRGRVALPAAWEHLGLEAPEIQL